MAADTKHFDADAVVGEVERLFWRRGVATTRMQEVVTATGLSRSSLYATFGGKRELYIAALRRYVERRSEPAFQRLAADDRGLPAVREFFVSLIGSRCSGEYARWGCMIANANASPESSDPGVRQVLEHHHERFRAALRSALEAAADRGQVRSGVEVDAVADVLALTAYGVNLRSRAGADAQSLQDTVEALLTSMANDGGKESS